MKVLFLLNSHYKENQGGAEFQAWNILEFIKAKGYDVSYLYLGANCDDEIYLNTNLYRIKKRNILERFFGKIIYYFQLKKKLKDINPDIIYHRNLSSFSLAALSYCYSNNCKFFLHIAHIKDVENKLYFGNNIFKTLLDYIIKKRIISNADKIIAQAQYQTDLLEKNFNIKTDLIIRNMHPLNNEELNKTRKIRVIWIANFKESKQPIIFLELAKRFREMDVEFFMIGRKGLQFQELESKIASLNNLQYVGEISLQDTNKMLSQSHIFVNTSLQEGFPNTFIQAWLREVPVVSLNIDPDDILVNNTIGFHSKYFEQLVADVDSLVNDKKLRMNMGIRAKEYAEKNHSLDNINKFIELIESVR